MRDGTRGQAYTLEAVVAAVLLIASLIFALQVTAVTPLSASTSSQHIENQQRGSAAGLLAAADKTVVDESTGETALKTAVLAVDADGEYDDPNNLPNNEFGEMIGRSLETGGLVVNVDVRHRDGQSSWNTVAMLDRGTPTDNAVTARQSVTLYDGDELESGEELGDPADGNADPFDTYEDGTDVYDVVQVEVTVWRM